MDIGPSFVPPGRPAPTKKFEAIWDTGATASAISRRVVDACALKPIGMAQVNTASGMHNMPVYLVSMLLPSRVGFNSVKVTLADIGNDDCLIGMDIISQGDFAITNKDGKTVFSFRVPSLEHIDFATRPAAPSGVQTAMPTSQIKGGADSSSPNLPPEFKRNPFARAIRFFKVPKKKKP